MAWRPSGPAGLTAPTAPAPAEAYRRDDGEFLGGLRWDGSRTMRRGQRLRRRLFRRIRRLVGIVMALFVLGTLLLVQLLMITPSVSSAPALARAFARSHGVVYPGPPVPQRAAASLIATEGHRFDSKPGIDPIAVTRLIAGGLAGRPNQGGFTLYRQLAKMLYTHDRNGVVADAEVVLLGIKLDLSYTQAAVLRMYAGVAYFGHGYYGLPSASCGYFGESPAHLSWGQTAMLVGLLQSPSADNPLSHLANARAGEVHVLDQLTATGWLTQPQATDAYRQPLHLATGHTAGCAASLRLAAHKA